MPSGGKRENAGRTVGSKNKVQSGLKARSIRLSDYEYDKVREFVQQLRKNYKQEQEPSE